MTAQLDYSISCSNRVVPLRQKPCRSSHNVSRQRPRECYCCTELLEPLTNTKLFKKLWLCRPVIPITGRSTVPLPSKSTLLDRRYKKNPSQSERSTGALPVPLPPIGIRPANNRRDLTLPSLQPSAGSSTLNALSNRRFYFILKRPRG